MFMEEESVDPFNFDHQLRDRNPCLGIRIEDAGYENASVRRQREDAVEERETILQVFAVAFVCFRTGEIPWIPSGNHVVQYNAERPNIRLAGLVRDFAFCSSTHAFWAHVERTATSISSALLGARGEAKVRKVELAVIR